MRGRFTAVPKVDVVADFLTLEEAAEQLGIDDTTLRRWIKRGKALASRRAGTYLLRATEVDRLRTVAPEDESEPMLSIPRAVKPSRPKAGADELLAQMQERLQRLEEMQTQAPAPDRSAALEERITDLTEELRARDQAIDELEARLDSKDDEKAVAAAVEAATAPLQERLAGLENELKTSRLELAEYRSKLDRLESEKAELAGQSRALKSELAKTSTENLELDRVRSRAEALLLEKEELLERVRALEASPPVDHERTHELERQLADQVLLAGRLERERDELRDRAGRLVRDLAARTRDSQDLDHLADRYDELVVHTNKVEHQLEQALDRLSAIEREFASSSDAFETREAQLELENRRLKEKLNDLQYKLELGGGSRQSEDARELLGQMAALEEQMAEKDALIQGEYREKAALIDRCEHLEREFYDLQQRYDKEKSEWSEILAREIQNRDRLIQQSYDPTPKGQQRGGWGLFRPKNDTR
ncbi:MAG: helix-turn-helix domain-containing protein [Vulcanimicrobiota bacterium]